MHFPKLSKKLDESGVEPKTSPMLRERATNYATRPCLIDTNRDMEYTIQ